MDQISARPAATIVVIREQNQLLEILMLRRSSEAVAASGTHVFAGGGVDEVDAAEVRRGLGSGLDAADADRCLELDSGALTFYCAALRELFEEAGLLLAVDSAGLPLQVGDAQLLTWREELVAQRVAWPELLEREGLRLALGEMRYLAHWVTPGRRPRRYDTRFFVAAAPVGQIVRVDGGEITEHVWMTASEALHRFETAEWTMLVPTVHTLRVLAPIHSVDEALHYAATSRARRTQPREIEREGRTVVVVPGEPGYED
jgi:8-oxo-dGTP pyrophosphatase MutT (NUDIX family)